MTDGVDADELLRRIRRARDQAREEVRIWQVRGAELERTDPEGAREARIRGLAYETVLGALDEIVAPGHGGTGPGGAREVKQVT
ncbi:MULTISPECIES: hypothetical protein [Streptomyces]|uniref:Uncharacterized protein n=2 Tax=Streptomyces TaxID=1883 RepID=A0ABV9IT05_9ACTN